MFIDMRQCIFQCAVDEDHFIDLYINHAEQCIECWLNKKIKSEEHKGKGNEYTGILKKTIPFLHGGVAEHPRNMLQEMKDYIESTNDAYSKME